MLNPAIANSNHTTNSFSSLLESRSVKTLVSITKIALNTLLILVSSFSAIAFSGFVWFGSVELISIVITTSLAATIALFPTLPILALGVATIAAAVAIAVFVSTSLFANLCVTGAATLFTLTLINNISKETFFIKHGAYPIPPDTYNGAYPIPPPTYRWGELSDSGLGEIPNLTVTASLNGAPSKKMTLIELEKWKEKHPRFPFTVEWTPDHSNYNKLFEFIYIYGNQIKKLDLSLLRWSSPELETDFISLLETALISLKNLESLSLPSSSDNFPEEFMNFLSRIKDVRCNEHQNQFVKVKLLFSTAKHQNISYNQNNRIANFSLDQNTIDFLDKLDKSNTLSLFSTAIEKIKNEDVFHAFLCTFSVVLTNDSFKTTFLENINQSEEINKHSISETLKKMTSQFTFASEEDKEMFYLTTDSFPEGHDIQNSLEKMVLDKDKTIVFHLFFDVEKREGPLFEFFTSEEGKVFLSKHQNTTFLDCQNVQKFIKAHFADDPRFYLAYRDENNSTLVVTCHYDFPEKFPKKALVFFLMAEIKNATLFIKYNNQKGGGKGVTRDFLTRMYEAIAKEYHNWDTKNLGYLGLAWKRIFCDEAHTKTGVVFESLLFERLCKLNYEDILNIFDLNKLETIQILLRLIPENDYLFTYLEKIKRVMEIDPSKISKISEEDNAAYEAIKVIYEAIMEDSLNIPTTPEEHQEFIEKFTAEILTIPTNPLRNLLEIARGLISTLSKSELSKEEDWDLMKSLGHEELSAIIQGVFNKETFIDSISFPVNDGIEDSELHIQIKEWIRDWTNERNDEQVKRLLFYITGSTVCSKIIIKILAEDANPCCQTCFKRMDLPKNITKEGLEKQFDNWANEEKAHIHIV